MGKTLVGKKSDMPPGTMKQIVVPGMEEIVLANVDGKFYAMRGVCNHAGGPLGDGTLEGCIITCPWHGAKWNIADGKMAEFAIDLDPEPTYKVIEENDNIYIDA